MSFSNLQQLIDGFQQNGAFRLYFKPLAPNDNSKNQIYFGPDFQALNIFPNGGVRKEQEKGKIKLKASLDFWWLDDDTYRIHKAPTAQLILYPQYPEVRFSGFLRGCKVSPNELMASRDEGRVLFLGVTQDDKVIGFVAPYNHPIVQQVEILADTETVGVFKRISLGKENQNTLIQKFREIYLKGWINSKRLDTTGNEVACNAPNCGGYTLEAELGIIPNGSPMPDYLGYEVKQYGVTNLRTMSAKSALTLMTPEPTKGYYRDYGVASFVRTYGYPDVHKRPDRLNFGGVFRCNKQASKTKLTLRLTGYDVSKKTFDANTGSIDLFDENGQCAAGWDFSALIEHWSKKHAKAVYVPSISQRNPNLQYCYGQSIFVGEGTDFLSLLGAIASQEVYYDPAIKLEKASTPKPKLKRRSQFRIKVASLDMLYHSWKEIDLLNYTG